MTFTQTNLRALLLQPVLDNAINAPLQSGGILLGSLLLVSAIYNLYLNPLSKFKGPWYFAVSDIPYAVSQLRGTSQYSLARVHERYGDVVRIGPRALSFTDAKAWDALYGHRKGVAALPKDPQFYSEMLLGGNTITRASDIDAIPIRCSLNAAFTSKNMAAQEPMLQEHLARLCMQLTTQSAEVGASGVDLRKWFTMLMFDISSNFGFGEDMGCVENGAFHEWAQFVLDFFFAATLLHQCHKFWPLAPILAYAMPPSLREAKQKHEDASLARVRKRMQREPERPDFMSHFIKQARKEELSIGVIEAQAAVLILAGSETSATGLTSATFFMLANPPVYQKLCEEIRSGFSSIADVTLQDVMKLKYLDAVIWEAMRIHAPIANGFTRVVPASQRDFHACGHHLPPSTIVHINHYASNTSSRNFTDPLMYDPERWLGAGKYAQDQRDVVQPFSFGPRNCPGRGFALQNMKLAMAHMIMTFDMELADGMQSWDQGQKVYNGWVQPPLHVILRKRD